MLGAHIVFAMVFGVRCIPRGEGRNDAFPV